MKYEIITLFDTGTQIAVLDYCEYFNVDVSGVRHFWVAEIVMCLSLHQRQSIIVDSESKFRGFSPASIFEEPG